MPSLRDVLGRVDRRRHYCRQSRSCDMPRPRPCRTGTARPTRLWHPPWGFDVRRGQVCG